MLKKHFIHIPKNGGMTIVKEPTISQYIIRSTSKHMKDSIYVNEVKTMMTSQKEPSYGWNHARWRDLHPMVQSARPHFAILRNPWTRAVSRWKFVNDQFDINHGKNKMMNNHTTYRSMSFNEWLEERHVYGSLPYYWHRAGRGWSLQKDYVTSEEGEVMVDCMRLEHLNEDLPKYLKIEMNRIKRSNVTNKERIDYRSFYTPRTRKIIEDWYGEDIEFFGFSFDGPATKNIWNITYSRYSCK